MSLPEESVAANTLPEVTTIPTGKKLIFTDPDTNEGGIITLENLSKQILQNLTSQTFTLDQGNLTLLQALNQLNSKALKIINAQSNEFEISAEGTSTITITADFEGFIPLAVVNIYSLSSDTYIANRYGLSPTTAIVKNISSEYARKTTIFVQYLCIK